MYINYNAINYHRIQSKNEYDTKDLHKIIHRIIDKLSLTKNNKHDDIINLQPIQSHIQKKVKRHSKRQTQRQTQSKKRHI